MSRKFTIYGMPGCSACASAKTLVEQKGETLDYVDVVAQNYTAAKLQAELGGIQTRTLPQIVISIEGAMTYIGGLPELREYLSV